MEEDEGDQKKKTREGRRREGKKEISKKDSVTRTKIPLDLSLHTRLPPKRMPSPLFIDKRRNYADLNQFEIRKLVEVGTKVGT